MENENKNAVTQTEEKTEEAVTGAVEKTEKEEKVEKTFTQEEVNAMLKKENAKISKKYEGIDLEEYKKWKEDQKTAEEKQVEKETKYQETLSQNVSLEQENKVLKSGVNVDDVDYVVFKVSKMEGEFEENLVSFLEDNPKYLTSNKEVVEKTVDLGGEHKATNTPDLSKMSYEEYKAYRKKQYRRDKKWETQY